MTNVHGPEFRTKYITCNRNLFVCNIWVWLSDCAIYDNDVLDDKAPLGLDYNIYPVGDVMEQEGIEIHSQTMTSSLLILTIYY